MRACGVRIIIRIKSRTITTLSISLVSFFLTQSLYAWSYYNPGLRPSEIQQRADPYTSNNVFSPHIQSHRKVQRNIYNPHSIYNDPRYAKPIYNISGKFQGTIGFQMNKNTSIVNSYNKFGNRYNQDYIDSTYHPNNPNNPYSQFQSLYDSNSGRHNPKYADHIFNAQRGYLGHDKYNIYNNNKNNGSTHYP